MALLSLDPRARMLLSQSLLGAAGGLLGAKNLGQGLGQGFMGAAQGFSAGNEMWRQAEDDRRREEREAAYRNLLSGGNPQMAEAGGTDVAQGGLLSSVTPQQRALLSVLPAEQGMGILAEQMFREAPQMRTLLNDEQERNMGLDTTGVYQTDPTGQIFTVREPEKAPFEGAVRGANGEWELSPVWLDARRQIAEAGRAPAAPLPDKSFENENALRDEFNAQIKGFDEAQRNYNSMQQLARDATGASDVALVFSFFKTIDPASTVREGEFASAAQAAGLPAQMIAAFQKLDNGQILPPQLRTDLVKAAEPYFAQRVADLESTTTRYSDMAGRYGLNPENIITDPRRASPAPPPGGEGGIPQFSSPGDPEFQALPSGSVFKDANGVLRYKP